MQYLVPCCLIGIHRGVLFKSIAVWRLHLKPETIFVATNGDLA
jgi:hypothetical protein